MARLVVALLLAVCLIGSVTARPLSAASSCGSLGSACCSNRACSAGSCLATAGDAQGTCVEFGGIYATSANSDPKDPKPVCQAGNAYKGDQCECPDGFKASCTAKWAVPDVSGKMVAAELCACSASSGNKFYGGFFGQDVTGKQCVQPNSVTGGCSCPSGMVATTLKSSGGVASLCQSAASPAALSSAGLAGAFVMDQSDNCLSPNGVTSGACTCGNPPAGFSACPFAGPTSVVNSQNQDAIAATSLCFIEPQQPAAAAVGLKTAALSRLFEEGVQGEIALNQNITLPTLSGHDYSVTGIKFFSLVFSNVNASISGNNQLRLQLHNGVMQGSIGRIEVKKGIFKTHCDAHPFNLVGIFFDITVDRARLSFPGGRLGIRADAKGVNIQASLQTVNMEIHGNIACDGFRSKIQDAVRSALVKAFQTDVPNAIANGIPFGANLIGRNVSSYKTTFELTLPVALSQGVSGEKPVVGDGATINVDLSLQGCGADIPAPSPSALIALPLRGSAFTTSPAENAYLSPPFSPAPADLNAALASAIGNRDAIICLTGSPLDAVAWAAYATNTLKYSVLPAMIPTASPLQLNTSNMIIAAVAPELPSVFPNDAMQIEVSCAANIPTAAAPRFTFGQGNTMLVTMTLDLTWNVRTRSQRNDSAHCVKDTVDSNFYICEAFNTQLDVQVNASFSLHQAGGSGAVTVMGQIKTIAATWELLDTQVGNVSTDTLDSLNGLVIPSVISYGNAYLKNNTVSAIPSIGPLSLTHVADPIVMKTSSGASQVCFGADIELHLFKNKRSL